MALHVKLTANREAILKKISSSRIFVEKGWVVAEKLMAQRFNRSKKLFFRDFLNHKVTKEIQKGPESGNSSGLLGGKGNLFSFFGFNEGEDPIGDLSLYLNGLFDFRRDYYRGQEWSFRINFPDEEQAAHYVIGKHGADYTTESWIEGVEKGYSGLNYYLRYSGKGRSSGGLQSKTPVRELSFTTTKYFSEIVDNFKRNIRE